MSSEIANLRNQFSVLIVEADLPTAQSLVQTVKAFGYDDVRFATTNEVALAAAQSNPPHLILYDYQNLEGDPDSALMDLRGVSHESLVLLMIGADQTLQALQLVHRSLAFDSVERPFISGLDLLQKIDRAITRLYYQFESEQLREYVSKFEQQEQAKVAEIKPAPVVETPTPSLIAFQPPPFHRFLNDIINTKDLDRTLQLFLDELSVQTNGSSVLYFKYLPGQASLMISQTAKVPIEKLRGVGIDLKSSTIGRIEDFFKHPQDATILRELMSEIFRKEKFSAFVHETEGEILGLFVVLNEALDIKASESSIHTLRQVFDLAWKRNQTMKEKHSIDQYDAATGLVNRRSFLQELDNEMSRARRLLMPVSLILLDIDGFHRLNDRFGQQAADSVLKAIGSILKKTARVSDIVGRTGPDEFACLLPHTPQNGAAIKAERLRRIIESTKFPLLKDLSPLTVSGGIAEYPSMCQDAEGMLRIAIEALEQMRDGTGNKICLGAAPNDFVMDFAAREIPFTGRPS